MDVTNINEAPFFENDVVNIDIDENMEGKIDNEEWFATDPDCVDGRHEAVNYVLKNGKQNFRIVPPAEDEDKPTLEILPGRGLNYEASPKFELFIRAEGKVDQQHSKKDLKEKPSMIKLAPQDIDLETGADVRVGDFTTVD